MRFLLYSAKPFDRESFDQANLSHGFSITYSSERLDRDSAKKAEGYDAICAFVNDDLSQPVIECLIRCGIRLIALRSAGYDHVDLKAAAGKIPIVHVPRYSPYAVAEHAAALLLSLNRHIPLAHNRTTQHNFTLDGLIGVDLHGKTAGIIGAGSIGKALARILNGFGMRLLLCDPIQDALFAEQVQARYTDLNTLISTSDCVSLHCPLTPQSHHMINATTLAKMKPSAILINTARGGLIDTKDLIQALKTERLQSAGLDVYERESPYFFKDCSKQPLKDPLLQELLSLPNVLLTSHQGFFTKEAVEKIAATTLENLQAFKLGEKLVNAVQA